MKDLVYLDYAATCPLLPEVREVMHEAEERFFANPSALHTPGHLAKNKIEECRETLAKMIDAEPDEIIFTSGATESNNTVINIFRRFSIYTSGMEHHSILEAIKATPAGNPDWDNNNKRSLYSIMLANNETGDILDFPKSDHRYELVHSDMTQALGKMPISVKKLGVDYATFSAHKIGGPVGVGALYVRRGVTFKPLHIGGSQERGRRGGTYNTVGIAGFEAALKYASEHKTWEIYDTKVRKLRDTLARRILAEIPGSSLNTDLAKGKSLPNILNASFEAAEGESIQLYLDAEGIVVSTGSACAAGDGKPSHVLMMKSGGNAEVAHSSIRFSFGLNNTMADVDRVMEVLPPIISRLQGMSTVRMKGENGRK